MAISYRYDIDNNIMWAAVTDTLTTEDMVTHIDRLLDKDVNRQGLIEIIDMDHVEDVMIRYSDLLRIRKTTALLAEQGHRISIFFSGANRGKEILQLMGPIFNQINLIVHICDNRDEALAYAQALDPARS